MTKISFIYFCFLGNSSVTLTFFPLFGSEKVIQAHDVVSTINIGLFESLLLDIFFIDFFFSFPTFNIWFIRLNFVICFDMGSMRLLLFHVLDQDLKR